MRRAGRWFGWKTVGGWTVGTAVGWAAAWIPITLLINRDFYPPFSTGDLHINMDPLEPLRTMLLLLATILAFAMLGACVTGSAQWGVFRAHSGTRRADAWLRATVLGMGAAWLVGTIPLLGWTQGRLIEVSDTTSELEVLITLVVRGVVMGGIGGLITGFAQAQVLRRWRLEGDGWIVVSVGAWVSGSLGYWLIYEIVNRWFSTIYSTYYVYHQGPWWLGRLGLPDYTLTMLIAGISSGLIVGAITGLALKRLLAGATTPHYQPLTPNP